MDGRVWEALHVAILLARSRELDLVLAGDELVVFGRRIHPHKGTAEAIAIAREANRRLVICGMVQDERYFHRPGRAAYRRRPRHVSRIGRDCSTRRCSRVSGRDRVDHE